MFLLRDVKETADELGLSEANVKVRLLRPFQLREQLTVVFGDPASGWSLTGTTRHLMFAGFGRSLFW